MTLVVDTSGFLAATTADEPAHEGARALVLSPFAAAEIDYLVTSRRGVGAELTYLQELEEGRYALAPSFSADDIAAATLVVERHRDLAVGPADASLVVLAEHYGTQRLLTLDERHSGRSGRRTGRRSRSFRWTPERRPRPAGPASVR